MFRVNASLRHLMTTIRATSYGKRLVLIVFRRLVGRAGLFH